MTLGPKDWNKNDKRPNLLGLTLFIVDLIGYD